MTIEGREFSIVENPHEVLGILRMIGAVSMKKTALALLCALLLALALTACGQDAAEPSSVPSEAAETPGAASGLVILCEADEDMINNYSLLAVNPDAPFVDADGNSVADVYINTEGAAALINWMLSAEGEAATAYANVLAVKEGRETDPAILALVDALKSDEVKTFIDETYAGAVVAVF